jgi:hypothetical protein
MKVKIRSQSMSYTQCVQWLPVWIPRAVTGEESYTILVWHSSIAEIKRPTRQIDLASGGYIRRNARHLFAGEPLSIPTNVLEYIETVLSGNSGTASSERESKEFHDGWRGMWDAQNRG